MIEQSFTSFMVAVPSLVALRGNRFNYLKLDSDFPAQTLHVTGTTPDFTLEDDGYQRLRIQIDHWAKDAFTALKLREATRLALKAVTMQPLVDGTVLQWCEPIGPLDFYDNDTEAFRCASEWYLHFTYPA